MNSAKRRESQMPIEDLDRVVGFYLLAKSVVLGEGFRDEIEWQDRLQFCDVGESHFLREAAWVVLSSGMRETVVQRKFAAFSIAFYDWPSARRISKHAQHCRKKTSHVFAHVGKIDSIIEIARSIDSQGFEAFKGRVGTEGVAFLRSLPFMGPTTSFHLAKNIGLEVVKPDRHLLRISTLAGWSSPAELCSAISGATGDRLFLS